MLKQSYFAKDPPVIIDVWLFKDKESYETNAKKLFGKTPDTPYRILFRRAQRLGDEHLDRRRDADPRDRASLHRGEFSRVPFLVQRRAWPRSTSNAARRTAKSTATPTGVWPACRRRSARRKFRRSKSSVRPRPRSFTTRTKARTTPKPDICAITFSRKALLKTFYKKFRANSAKDPTGYKTLQEVLGRKGTMEEFQAGVGEVGAQAEV